MPESWEDVEVPDTWESRDACEEAGSPIAAPAPEPARARPTVPRGSGHSRLRKDLVNLDRATSKWLRQERDGRLNLGELVERIRSSPAAQQLRTAHGQNFREEEFVEGVLARATAISA